MPGAATVVGGERVASSQGGYNPSFQRHRAHYQLAATRLGPGRVLDLGCGTGHSYEELAPRESVGLDIDPGALQGQDRETQVGDIRQLPFSSGSFESAISIHSLEHVPDPERVIHETGRVLVSTGRAIFATPNRLTFGRPDEIINPYHYVEFDADELRTLCLKGFGSVEVLGMDVSERYRAIHDDERRELARMLRRDPLRVRRLIPRRVRQRLYDWRLDRDRVAPRPGALDITTEDFSLSPDRLQDSIDLVAVCDEPRR